MWTVQRKNQEYSSSKTREVMTGFGSGICFAGQLDRFAKVDGFTALDIRELARESSDGCGCRRLEY